MQVVAHPRLGDVTENQTAVEHGGDFSDTDAAGEQDACRVRLRFLRFFEQLNATSAGEVLLDDYDAKNLGLQMLARKGVAVHGGDVEAHRRQLLLERGQHERVVVHGQHFVYTGVIIGITHICYIVTVSLQPNRPRARMHAATAGGTFSSQAASPA